MNGPAPGATTGVPAMGRRGRPVETVMVATFDPQGRHSRPERVAGEEPLELRVAGPGAEPEPLAVTMRTPGHDFELAVGFLLSEGVVTGQDEVRAVRYCDLADGDPQQFNVVTVSTAHRVDLADRGRRTTVSASCGVCGTATIDDLKGRCPSVPEGDRVRASVLTRLPEELRRRQRVFQETGGLHAAGLFDPSGRLLAAREDVGRHNAVDKLVGWAALARRLPLAHVVLAVSGRVSYEIVQKAAVAGIPIVVAVSAPSSLAVSTAQALGMTLAGFVREGRANVYSAPWRVLDDASGRADGP